MDAVDFPAAFQQRPGVRGHGTDKLVSQMQDGTGQRRSISGPLRKMRNADRTQKP